MALSFKIHLFPFLALGFLAAALVFLAKGEYPSAGTPTPNKKAVEEAARKAREMARHEKMLHQANALRSAIIHLAAAPHHYNGHRANAQHEARCLETPGCRDHEARHSAAKGRDRKGQQGPGPRPPVPRAWPGSPQSQGERGPTAPSGSPISPSGSGQPGRGQEPQTSGPRGSFPQRDSRCP